MKRALNWYAGTVYLFLHLPLAILVLFSFNSSRVSVWTGFSLEWYRNVLRDPHWAEAAANSAIIALVSTMISTAAGTLAAYGMWKRRAPWLAGSLYLSLVTPEIVTGVSLLAFFQWIFRWLDLRLGMHTVILAHVAFSVAYVAIVVSARLRTFDRTQEEAAMDLGATEWQAFLQVTLPQLAPAVGAAALLALAISFDDYVITSLVAGVDSETLPMMIYAIARRGANPALNAASSLVIVSVGGLIVISERMRR